MSENHTVPAENEGGAEKPSDLRDRMVVPHIPLPTDELVDYTQYYTKEPDSIPTRPYEMGS